MFAPRTTPLIYGEEPWKWDVDSVWQCTWYSFWRFFQVHGIYPTYQSRATKSGSYNNANTWLENYRDPVKPMGKDYVPVAGDIVVYDWSDLGHVAFMETDTMTSSYGNGKADSFKFQDYRKFNGEIMGYLHSDYYPILPVERNENVNQIETTDDQLRIRTAPSLDAEIVGHVQLGYYNVLSQTDADGYTWYEIAKDRWCANITTNYLPAEQNDFVRQLEKFLNDTKAKINALEEENKQMRADYTEVKNIAQRWTK
jgi:hypothetical protein